MYHHIACGVDIVVGNMWVGRLYESEKGKGKSEKSDCCDGGIVRGALVDELKRFYDYLLDGGLIVEIDGLRFVLAYLSGDMIDADKEPSLY